MGKEKMNIGDFLGIGLGVAGGAIDLIGQRKREERAMKNQMALNQQGKDLALQQWKDTNYAAQREEMEKAGLNVGMMYGMSGGGGTTASTGSGGSAPSPQRMPMDMASMMQLGLLKAQKENIEADTANKKAEASFTGGAKTASTEASTTGTTIANKTAQETQEANILALKAEADKKQSDARIRLQEANVSERTIENTVQQIKNEAIQSAIEIEAKKQGIKLSEAQIKNMEENIKIGKYNAEKISTDQVTGKQLNSLIEKIYDLFGIKNEQIK